METLLKTDNACGNDTLDRPFDYLMDAAPVMIWKAGVNQTRDYFNKAAQAFTGRTLAQLAGEGWKKNIHPEDAPASLTAYASAFASRQEFKAEYRLLRLDGEYRWILDHGIPYFLPTGKFFGYIGSCIDITARKQAEMAWRESERRYQALFNDNPSICFTLDQRGVVIAVNAFGAHQLGYRVEELVGASVLRIFHPEDRALVVQQLHECLKQPEKIALLEFRKIRKDGGLLWVKATVRVAPDATGQPVVLIVCQEITEQKLAEAQLKNSKEQFQLLFELAPIGMVIKSIEGRCLDANPAFCQALAYSREELIAKQLDHLTHPDDLAKSRVLKQQLLNGAIPYFQMEKRYLAKDGSVVYAILQVSLISNTNGTPLHFIGQMVNITERKQVEQEIIKLNAELEERILARTQALQESEGKVRASEERYELATEAGRVTVWDWCIRSNEIYIDPKLKLMLGYEPGANEIRVEEWMNFIHPDDLAKVKEQVKAHFAGQTASYQLEHRLLQQNGIGRWFMVHGHVIRDVDGQPCRMLGTHTDITDRKKAEQALQESNKQFQQIAANINGVLWMESLADRRILYISPNYEKVWGRTRASLYENPDSFLDATHPEDLALYKDFLRRQRQGEYAEIEYRIFNPAGDIRWIRDSCFPIQNDDGEVYRAAGFAQDITERKLAQETNEKLRQRNIRAAAMGEAQEKERRRFARELHDGLGQILTGIKFRLEALKPLLAANHEAHAKNFAAIEEQLNNAIIEGKRIALDLMPLALDENGLLPALQQLCQHTSQQSGLYVEFFSAPRLRRLPARFEFGLYRIAQEALTNVSKHAQAQQATLRLDKQKTEIILTITDNGRGFQVAEKSGPAAGMGLPNMRARAEALNGTLVLLTQPGAGTQITVTVPLE